MARPLHLLIAHPSPMLTDHLPHGDGLAAHGYISRLAERGHRLDVAVEAVDLERDLGPSVRLHPMRGRASAPGTRRPEYLLRLRRLATRLAAEDPYDLVHQLNPVDAGLSLSLPRLRAPLVLGPYVPNWPAEALGAAHGPAARLAREAGERARQIVLAAQQRRATTVLLSTPAAEERLRTGSRELPLRRELGAGIDTGAFRPPPDGAAGAADGPILFLANLERWKGIHTLLDAFEGVAGRLGDRRLAIAGGGQEEDAVRRRVAASRYAGRIDVLGQVPRTGVPSLLQRCGVYCLPSAREPFGISVLEAMACGRPVVVTDAGGLRHLVDDGGGRRVPPGDAAALGAALRDVLGAPGTRAAMGAHNRRLAVERHDWERVVDRLELLYAEAIEVARHRAGP